MKLNNHTTWKQIYTTGDGRTTIQKESISAFSKEVKLIEVTQKP
jgi:hypothetical protein